MVRHRPGAPCRAGAGADAGASGEADRYNNCCIVERVRAIEAAARSGGAPFELVVYPRAEHGFALKGTTGYVRRDAEDSWRRALEMLNVHHPVTSAPRN
jgi:dienelactone hydrolase